MHQAHIVRVRQVRVLRHGANLISQLAAPWTLAIQFVALSTVLRHSVDGFERYDRNHIVADIEYALVIIRYEAG